MRRRRRILRSPMLNETPVLRNRTRDIHVAAVGYLQKQ